MNPHINLNKKHLTDFCKQNHIRRLAFFGSVLRDDFRPESDIDVLIEFEDGYTPGFAFFRLENELSALLGRRVDLNTPKFISHYIRDRVIKESEVLYAQAG